MKKTLTFYTKVDLDGEWLHEFSKGDGWNYRTYIPDLYVNREHVINNNLKEYRKTKSKTRFWKNFRKIKITMEDAK